jgi:N-acetylmuramoyl-L-alanine amidase
MGDGKTGISPFRWLGAVLAALGLALAGAAALAEVRVGAVQVKPTGEGTRLTLELSAPAEHSLFTLPSPDRVVIDLRQARLQGRLGADLAGNPHVTGIRAAPRGEGDLRVVLDLKAPARPRSFLVKPDGEGGHRLVVDLVAGGGDAGRPRSAAAPARAVEPPLRDVVVAIDAGHGGVDPGAIGPAGTREKHVTLGIARALESLLRRERGMRAVMTRTRDVFIPLRKRTAIARTHRADLFVSIHADAYEDRQVSGASVYTLSRNGASSEVARWLAERENAADLVGGVKLDDKDDVLASVLLDLSQTGTLEASLDVAGRVLRRLGRVGGLHKPEVQQAGFVVLKSPDIPSILVETAFISNPAEERRLLGQAYQQEVARAVLEGIREFFAEAPPPGTLLSARRHVISKGDRLAALAERYQVSPEALRAVNGLTADPLPVGKVLTIPTERGS